MPQQLVDVIYLPFVTGLVGYLTNKLAIKMLFRPYKARWYTLGWQGVVPRTRPALAQKIARVVGGRLIAHDDILEVISGSDFRIFLQNSVSSRLSGITEKDIVAIFSEIDIKNIIERNSGIIDKAGSEMLETFLSKPLSEYMNPQKTAQKAGAYAAPRIAGFLSSEISGFINNLVYSGKTLEEITPEPILKKTDEISSHITESAARIIKAAGRSAAVKEAAAEKVIEFKNSFFGGGGPDMLKMGLLNMFLNDETISNTVKRELPSFLDGIADIPSVRNSIQSGVKAEIEKILKLKLSDAADKAGKDLLPSLNAAISQQFSSAGGQGKINAASVKFIAEISGSLSSMTTRDALKKAGAYEKIKELRLSMLLLSWANTALSSDFCRKAALYVSSRSHKISILAADKIIALIKSNLASVLEKINIEKTVKNKINGLSLAEVEDILFSFMRTHFKWINILGFAIGFVIGCIQLVITKFI